MAPKSRNRRNSDSWLIAQRRYHRCHADDAATTEMQLRPNYQHQSPDLRPDILRKIPLIFLVFLNR